MPFGDGTGPSGKGPLSGRRAGYCAGFPTPGAFNCCGWGYGLGFGRGFGRGHGFRHRFWATGVPYWAQGAAEAYPVMPPFFPAEQVDEAKILKQQAAYLKEQLNDIQERLAELENNKEDETKDK
ncbi:MAG: DUF5320 domain-containing protein [Firmicutes bacterium]|jgi:hypothetical protein|nr:DUF5320 domain-containing protein [Bacillota bacterium]